MNTSFEQIPLSEIVKENPSFARVFLDLEIDFCCGGTRTLSEACGAQELDIEQVKERLIEVGKKTHQPPIDPEQCSLVDLKDYIVKEHHAFIKESTAPLLALLEKIEAVHGEAHPELIEVHQLFQEAAIELKEHLGKEETMLFPLLSKLDLPASNQEILGQKILACLDKMEGEHEEEGVHFKRMAEITDNFVPPSSACTSYRAAFHGLKVFRDDLFVHIHLENNVLFPRVRTAIS